MNLVKGEILGLSAFAGANRAAQAVKAMKEKAKQ
jgi:hypothetical protein